MRTAYTGPTEASADDSADVEEQNEYDTCTRVGTMIETEPVRDRVLSIVYISLFTLSVLCGYNFSDLYTYRHRS